MIGWRRYRELCVVDQPYANGGHRMIRPSRPVSERSCPEPPTPDVPLFVHRPTWLPWRRPFRMV